MKPLAPLVVAAALLGACTSGPVDAPLHRDAPPPQPAGPTSATHLSATRTSPVDVTLHWSGDEPGAVARVVEYATAPAGPYTILEFVPIGRTTFEHPDLMPQTTFYYRVRAVLGPASAPVEVTLPPGETPEDADRSWADPRSEFRGAVAAGSIRDGGPTDGAPTDFTATVMDPTGIRLTWTDHASDEEGYLLEARGPGQPDYAVLAVLDPDVNSFGVEADPSEKKATYRIRAFYYGPSSNVVHQKTGRSP